MKEKILISTGGSGGHVIPALNFCEHLNSDYDIFLTTDLRGLKFIKSNIYNIKIIDVPDIKKSIFKLPINLFYFLISIIQSIIFLKKYKINKIISTGGYMTLPVCIASLIVKSKLFLFEPNMVLGRSNSIFLNKCKKIFCYSKKINKFPDKYQNKIEIIYPIIKKENYHLDNLNEKKTNQKIFLIIGGSQGANFFQTELNHTINKLAKKFKLFVYHQTNRDNFKTLEFFYNENNISYNLFDFSETLQNIYRKTDFCITRAGASTLAELVFFKVPFLAIPFPHSMDDHQLYNARFYENKNCCWLIKQKDITKNKLFEIISNIIFDKKDIQLKKKAMEEFNLKNTWKNNNKLILKTLHEN